MPGCPLCTLQSLSFPTHPHLPENLLLLYPQNQSQMYSSYLPTKVTTSPLYHVVLILLDFLASLALSVPCGVLFPSPIHITTLFWCLSGPAFSVLGAPFLCLPFGDHPYPLLLISCSDLGLSLFSLPPCAANTQTHSSSPDPRQLTPDSESVIISTWVLHGHLEFNRFKMVVRPPHLQTAPGSRFSTSTGGSTTHPVNKSGS